MAISGLNVLSGIGAAVAGLSGEKVSKTGAIPGFDLAAIIPALLGKATGGTGSSGSNLLGTLTSAVVKSGLINSSNLASLAGSLFSFGKQSTPAQQQQNTSAGGIAGLAAAILGNSGQGADLVSIAKMATGLAKTANDSKGGLTGIASELGKALSGSGDVHLAGGATALKALDKVMQGDTKTELLKAVLKGLV